MEGGKQAGESVLTDLKDVLSVDVNPCQIRPSTCPSSAGRGNRKAECPAWATVEQGSPKFCDGVSFPWRSVAVVVGAGSNDWGGSVAPDDLNAGAYTAYGFNWVFGDTQSNYLNGYLVSNPSLTVVPEPSTLALLAAACLGLLACVRRRGN